MTPDRPLVSVITPTYNHEQFLGRCIDSVLAQTDRRWEQIVIDDGSSDGTREVALSYDDPRIICLHQENTGILNLANTYNRALERASGEFIAVLEGDDFWPADKLALQLETFDDPAVVLSWGYAMATDETGTEVERVPQARFVHRAADQTAGQAVASLLEINEIPSSTVMCRREAVEAIGGFQQPPGIPFVDNPTWLELCKVGPHVAIPEVLGFYRAHDQQVSSRMNHEMYGTGEWISAFVDGLSPADLTALDLDSTELHRIADRRRSVEQFGRGRFALRDGQSDQAAEFFRAATRRGPASTRIYGWVGLACARTGVDFGHFERLREFAIESRDRLSAAMSRAE